MFGYRAGEVLGRSVEVLIPERYRDGHTEEVRNFSAGGVVADRIMGNSREVAGLRKNGEEFPVEATVSRRMLGGRKVLTVVVRDISERKRLQQQLEERNRALEESENRLRLALKGGQMGAWEWDLRTNGLRADVPARQLWGISKEGPLTVESAFARVHPDDLPGVKLALRESIQEGLEYNRDFRILRSDETALWVSGKATVIRDSEGEAEKMIGVTFDVTDRQEMEEQRGLLAAELHHRMKNMMALVNAVVSMTARNAGSIESYKKTLQGRLGAIAGRASSERMGKRYYG